MIWTELPQEAPTTKLDWRNLKDLVDPYFLWLDFTGLQVQSSRSPQGPRFNLNELPLIPSIIEFRNPPVQGDPNPLDLKDRDGNFFFFLNGASSTTRFFAAFLSFPQLAKVHELTQDPIGKVVRYELGQPIYSPVGFRILGNVEKDAIRANESAAPLADKFVGFIDYGCAFSKDKFLRKNTAGNWETRVAAIWDQTIYDGSEVFPTSPGINDLSWNLLNPGFGREVSRSALSSYMSQFSAPNGRYDEEACYRFAKYSSLNAEVSHGTHMMDIATGVPNPILAVTSQFEDFGSPESQDIVFVNLPRFFESADSASPELRQVTGLLRMHLLAGARYISSKVPAPSTAVINVSYGGHCGPHDGTTVLESALDELIAETYDAASKKYRLQIAVAAGNSADRETHAQCLVESGKSAKLKWMNFPDDPSDSFIEFWMGEADILKVSVWTPSDELRQKPSLTGLGAGESSILRSKPGGAIIGMVIFPKFVCQTTKKRGRFALLALAPTTLGGKRDAAPYGAWTFKFENVGAATATISAWCERDDPVFATESGPRQGVFLDDPSASAKSITSTGTLNTLAHGYRTRVSGSYMFMEKDLPVSTDSSTGPGRGIARNVRFRHEVYNGVRLKGPEVLAPGDQSYDLPGIPAASIHGADTARLRGTSVAAAYTTRYLSTGGTWPPISISLPGANPDHPDEKISFPRI
jgi:hypothetical protein